MDWTLETWLLFIIIAILIFSPIFNKVQRKLFTKKSRTLKKLSASDVEVVVETVYEAVRTLSKVKTGALITFESGESLEDYIKSGQEINSSISASLLVAIFNKKSPLHDGSVIITGNSLACSSAYFPTSKQDIPSRYGARHRAALGVTEVRDSVVVTVSETDGSIHIVQNGKMVKVILDKFSSELLGRLSSEKS